MGGKGYEQLFQAMAQGAMCHGIGGRVIAINRAAEEILDTTAFEMTNVVEPEYYWVQSDGTRYQKGMEPWNRVLQTGESVIGEQVGFCRVYSGLCRWISVNASVFPDTLDPMIKVFTTFVDVTRQIELHEQLQASEKREKHASEMLQSALRPPDLKNVEGYRIAGTNIPFQPETQVCGDVYDSFSNKGGRHCVMIADVAGKGLQSATLAVAARDYIYAYAYENPSIGRVLNLTNDLLCSRQVEKGEYGIFVTAAVAMIDPKSGIFHFASAGHDAPALYRPDGSVTLLSTGELPLGIQTNLSYRSSGHQLERGGKIVFYTDGLSESRRPDGEMFGPLELQRCIAANGHLSAKELLDKLVQCVWDWSEGRIKDDLTAVVVERL